MKFGCHDFLNSMPILYPFNEKIIEPPFELHLGPPSELADMLEKGGLDIAFIPSIEYARIGGLKIVPGFCISSLGEVKTVAMFSKKKMVEIETIAADTRSRTSVAMLKLIFIEYFRRHVKIIPRKRLREIPANADAALLIGDEALELDPDEYMIYDVSKMWFSYNGKPAVFALLCVREGVNADEAVSALKKAIEISNERMDDICYKAAQKLSITPEACREYLTRRIRYTLNEEDMEGLRFFFDLAHKHRLLPENPPLNFYGSG